MKNLRNIVSSVVVGCVLLFVSCEKTVGPNEIGGDTNLENTKVGSQYFASVWDPDTYIPGFDHMYDTIFITKNNGGIVTAHAEIGFDSLFVKALDSALGTGSLSPSLRAAAIDVYTKRFGATLDTADKAHMKLRFDLKMKVTSEGIQEFVNSKGDESKPYTIIKYSAAVGDKYEFTNSEGVKITRAVTYKSTTDDYPIGFWMIKVTKVEETKEDLLVQKITYYANHKFGLVGVLIETKTGKILKLGIYPPNL